MDPAKCQKTAKVACLSVGDLLQVGFKGLRRLRSLDRFVKDTVQGPPFAFFMLQMSCWARPSWGLGGFFWFCTCTMKEGPCHAYTRPQRQVCHLYLGLMSQNWVPFEVRVFHKVQTVQGGHAAPFIQINLQSAQSNMQKRCHRRARKCTRDQVEHLHVSGLWYSWTCLIHSAP